MGWDVETEIIIDAPVEKVWEVFIDMPGHAKWDMLMKDIKFVDDTKVSFSVDGTAVIGEIMVNEPNKELRWAGVFGAPFIFRGEHYFLLEKKGKKTRFVHGEHFTGLALFVLKTRLQESIPGRYAKFNEALKKEVESR